MTKSNRAKHEENIFQIAMTGFPKHKKHYNRYCVKVNNKRKRKIKRGKMWNDLVTLTNSFPVLF